MTVSYTLFPTVWPKTSRWNEEMPWTQFVSFIRNIQEYPKKSVCPLISMCQYGETLSRKGYLRWGGNVLRVWGGEIDYDGGEVAIEEAASMLTAFGVRAVLYTSPSHTKKHPRWRALFPFSQAVGPDQRKELLGRANAILGGLASRESFTLSQSFYIGRIPGHDYVVVETDGKGIDEFSGIEPRLAERTNGANGNGHVDEDEVRAAFLAGRGSGRYELGRDLIAKRAAQGKSKAEIDFEITAMIGADVYNDDGVNLLERLRKSIDSAIERYGPKLTSVTIVDRRTRFVEEKIKSLPPTPDGLIAEISEWAGKRSFSVNPKLDLGVALTAVAFSTLNRYLVDTWKTPLQPYVLTLARTGGGKTEAQKSLTRLAGSASSGGFSLVDHMFSGFQSHHSFSDKLAEEPHTVLWSWDEAARAIKSSGRGGPDYDVLTHLIKMYGQANDTVLGMPGRNSPIPTIENPFLVVFAMAQPDQLVGAVTQTDFETGLLARLLLLDTGDAIPRRNEHRSDLLKASIARHLRSFRETRAGVGFQRVRWDSGIERRALEFDDHCRFQMAKGPMFENFWSRALQQTLMIAGLVAVSRSVSAPVITSDAFDYGMALATHSVGSWISRFGTEAAGTNPYEKLVLKLKGDIGNPRKFKTRAKNGKERGMVKSGWISKSMIARSVTGSRRRDVDDVLETLVEAGEIERKLVDGVTAYRGRNDLS